MHYFIDRDEWLNDIRSTEFNIIFKQYINKRFHNVLDLGAGEGFSSLRLASISDFIVSAEYNFSRLIRIESIQINRIVADAEKLCFKRKKFDLVFLSNLLEHLPDTNLVLKNIYNILTDEGLVVITVPNRVWKLLNVIFFYPNQFGRLIETLLDRSKLTKKLKLNSNIKAQRQYGFIRRNICPVPHGLSKSNLYEIYIWGLKQWLHKINNGDFVVNAVIENLPLYSGYPLAWENSILSVLSKLGFSSSYAFILKKNK